VMSNAAVARKKLGKDCLRHMGLGKVKEGVHRRGLSPSSERHGRGDADGKKKKKNIR